MAYRGREAAVADLSFQRPAKRRGGAGGGGADDDAEAKRLRNVAELDALLGGGGGGGGAGAKKQRSTAGGAGNGEEEADEDEDDYDAELVETGATESSRRRRLKDLDDESDEEGGGGGAGGGKKKPPKDVKLLQRQDKFFEGQEDAEVLEEDGNRIEPFNMNEELEEGDFDETGNYMRKKTANQFRDAWFDSITGSDIKKAKDAAAKMQKAAAEEVRLEATPANRLRLIRVVVDLLRDGETPMMGLARLGPKRTSAAGRGRSAAHNAMAVDADAERTDAQRAQFNDLTEACDQLMGLGEYGIYQERREALLTQLPAPAAAAPTEAAGAGAVHWRYKWTADGEIFGPFTSEQMAAWSDQGLFGTGVLVQKLEAGEEPAEFYSSRRVDFSLYTD